MKTEVLKQMYADLIEWQRAIVTRRARLDQNERVSHEEVIEKISSFLGFIEISDDAVRSKRSWVSFIHNFKQLNDPLLEGLFKQMKYVSWNGEGRIMTVSLPNDHKFFKDWLKDTESIWMPYFRLCMGEMAELDIVYETAAHQA